MNLIPNISLCYLCMEVIMEKKYQIFISSTFIDLEEERKEVIQALLELDCILLVWSCFRRLMIRNGS